MITIRSVQPHEKQAVLEFEERVSNEKNITSAYDMMSLIRCGYVLVAKKEDMIVGLLIAMRTTQNEIEVLDWLVDSNFRRKGIGKQLYQTLARSAGNIPINALVRCDNVASVAAHEKMFFTKKEKIIDPYGLGEDHAWWYMQKQ